MFFLTSVIEKCLPDILDKSDVRNKERKVQDGAELIRLGAVNFESATLLASQPALADSNENYRTRAPRHVRVSLSDAFKFEIQWCATMTEV